MSSASAARACSTARSAGLRALNARGYGRDPRLMLNLVYNPQGPSLPPAQSALEADYKRVLGEQYGIVFDKLFVLANMPIQRFGSALVTKGEFDGYLQLLQDAHLDANLAGVMCRNLISVDWQGFVYDCDFNQMLGLDSGARRTQARAACRAARRRSCRQCGARRRALLWLHRRARLELRRRAERGGGMNMLARPLPELPAQAEEAGRNCPRDYAYAPAALARAPDFSTEALYVVGRAVRQSRRARGGREAGGAGTRGQSCSTAISIGSTPSLRGSPPSSAACVRIAPCAATSRPSSRGRTMSAPAAAAPIRKASTTAWCGAPMRSWRNCAPRCRTPRARACVGLPMHLVAQVGALRVGIVHGDAASLAGWRFAPEALDDAANRRWLAAARAESMIDVFACTHTCLAALRDFSLQSGRLTVINNGAAGMANFSGSVFGVVTRIATSPSPQKPLYGIVRDGVHIDALALDFDQAAFLERFSGALAAGLAGACVLFPAHRRRDRTTGSNRRRRDDAIHRHAGAGRGRRYRDGACARSRHCARAAPK